MVLSLRAAPGATKQSGPIGRSPARDCSAQVKPAGRNDSCGRAWTIADVEPGDRVAILSAIRSSMTAYRNGDVIAETMHTMEPHARSPG
jgi:hypothetical protein